jgi:diadenosine tetraphosphate (Ap4A) HIT family hydrolase
MYALASEAQVRQSYHHKLSALLKAGQSDRDHGLAAFILACANAYFDGEILTEMQDDLNDAFQRLSANYGRLLADGRLIDERYAEDLLVFLKIGLVGLRNLRVAEHRQVAWWRVQFNHIRSFRPQRTAARAVSTIVQPFNEYSFYYTPELCQRESFWSGDLAGKPTYLLYNKYPFARMHTLLIPEPEKHHPQFLTPELHDWAWQATQALADDLPGFGMGYNAIGTFASVNHLHFQSFIEPRGMPVTWDIWQHNGGSESYPTACAVFDAREDAWRWIAAIHEQDFTSYNILYTPEKIYCFERKRQGSYKHSSWTSGFAWFEVCGNLITFNREDYTTISFEQIEREFKKLHVNHESNSLDRI